MKHLSLKDVMATLKVTIKADGYELSSPAGSANYDAWGSRTTVNGVPEYFPLMLQADNHQNIAAETPSNINAMTGMEDYAKESIRDRYQREVDIANSIDNFKHKHAAFSMAKLEGKTVVTFLANRFTVFGESFTPDEARETIEFIRQKRTPDLHKVENGKLFINKALIQPDSIKNAEIGMCIAVNNESEAERLQKIISDTVTERIRKEMKSGGLLHKR